MITEIDIDRLHYVIDNNPEYRQAGKTTAILYKMLGECQLGDSNNQYLYVGINQDHITQVMEEFITLLNMENISYNGRYHDSIELNNGQSFKFCSVHNAINKTVGNHFDEIWVDLGWEVICNYLSDISEVLARKGHNHGL